MFWSHTVGHYTVNWDSTPFSIGEKRLLHCQYGKQYFKPHQPTTDRIKLQSTRKIGCSASLHIRKFIFYPEYSVHSELSSKSLTKKQERKVKEAALQQLKDKLTNSASEVRTIDKYFVSLPASEAHHDTHPTGASVAFSQKVNPLLIQKIHELVLAGVSEPIEMKRHLKHHVLHYLSKSGTPDPNDRAYYPTLDDIRNHMNQAQKTLKLSLVDQENVSMKTAEYHKLSPETKIHFQPFTKPIDNENSNGTELLWVHQEPWQQDLLIKYGNTVSMIDATYKSTKYDLPLFFITVRTNTGYCVVAEFIVQGETKESIQNALSIIKSWNPRWAPKYFMTDYSEAEISALEAAFPDTVVYLCDFHREQAWERWVKASKHGLSNSEADILLDHLRAIAWAPSANPEEFEEGNNFSRYHHYDSAVAVLKATNLWNRNSNVRQWLTTTWLNISEVCHIYVVTISVSYSCMTFTSI